MLFESHDVARQHLIQALMAIFVDIEFTGDSMEFEAKFRKEGRKGGREGGKERERGKREGEGEGRRERGR